ncbi:hypothetical protein CHLRE_11g476400v5 [Chlamydomonas reinhardtii]|uniref:HhH-GPD domain-containing protein n=1 Tax=Chlamydomonas reinhardtii TaxID=3055 RepID=A0A2K3D8D5_CHLRE|nr:uncharacterized protein CHLRE_11g476400v5 [Chlamydomonas reinhardtii]PNW76794.1 hypothetical protein CHLRE_11g476400v5 [Chlamydomonas reinhardtii]
MLEVALKQGVAAAGAAVGFACASPEDGPAATAAGGSSGQTLAVATPPAAAAAARRSKRIAGLSTPGTTTTTTTTTTAAAAAEAGPLLPATPVPAAPPRATAGAATTPPVTTTAEQAVAGAGRPRRGRPPKRPRLEAAEAVAGVSATTPAGAAAAEAAVAGGTAVAGAGASGVVAAAAATAPSPALRSVSDLEAAVAHLRRVDPRLHGLIDVHGLPRPLIAVRFNAGGSGAAPAAAACEGEGEGGPAAAGATAGAATAAATAAQGTPTATTTIAAAVAAPAIDDDWDPAAGGTAGGSMGASGAGGVFSALARSVAYQQLATKAASTIWGRVLGVCQVGSTAALTPAHILAAPPEALRGAGLSGRKLEYLVGLAQAFSGRPGWEQELEALTDVDALVAQLTPLRGIGEWTVHMIAMMHLGLPDVLPTGDLGVRRGLQLLYGLRQLPDVRQVEEITAGWAPYRSVGSWYMWRIPPPPRTAGGGSSSSKAKAVGSSKPAGKGRAAKGK